jgi:hypothetical protein
VQSGDTLTIDQNTTWGTSPVSGSGADALTIQGSGSVVIAANQLLSLRGEVTWSATNATDRAFTLNAGSILELDSHLASNPATTYRVHGTNMYSYTAITANGTGGDHAIIRSHAGGGNFYLVDDNYGGGITAAYTDFIGVGDAINPLSSVWTSSAYPTGNDWNVTDSTFTG